MRDYDFDRGPTLWENPVTWAYAYIVRLRRGETVSFRPRGDSMAPRIKSGALCTVEPLRDALQPSDVVLCHVGGKWKKSDGFAFAADVDASELVHQARTTGSIIDPRAADFFETPNALAMELVEQLDLKAPSLLLEPSAGRGAIVRAMRRRYPEAFVFAVEPVATNLRELRKLPWSTDDGIFDGDFPDGSFRESGTDVRTVTIKMRKAAA